MRLLRQIRSAGLLLACLDVLPKLQAQECQGPFSVSQPDDLSQFLDNCTTILGDITIENTYEGPFNLSTVTNVTGAIRIPAPSEDNNGFLLRANITSFGFEELTSIGGLDLDTVFYAVSISLPKLQTVDDIFRVNASSYSRNVYGLDVGVPAVTEMRSLFLAGEFSRLDFGSLRKVADELKVAIDPSRRRGWPQSFRVELPLVDAGVVELTGDFDSAEFPNLATVKELSAKSSSTDLNCTAFFEMMYDSPFGLRDSTTGEITCQSGNFGSSRSMGDYVYLRGGDEDDEDHEDGGGLDTEEKILVGVLVPFGCFVAFLFVVCGCAGGCMPIQVEKTKVPGPELTPIELRDSEGTEGAEEPSARPGRTEHPLPSPTRDSSPPPPYSPRAP